MWVQYRVPATFTVANANGDVDWLSIAPAANKITRLVGWIIGNQSEVGDAQEEALRVTVRHMTATVTITTGTTITAVANHPGTDPAAGGTYKVNHATVATTTGTSTVVEELAWNERNSPWERWIPEEQRPQAISGEALLVRQETTVADDVVLTVTFFVEELI